MRIKHLFAFVLIFTISFMSTGRSYANNILSNPASPDEVTCDLAAPFDFHINEIGPDWIEFGWSPWSPTISHRIRVYESNGALVATVVVPGGVFEIIVGGLQPGEEYYAIINAICQDGENSINENIGPKFQTLILDLIVQGFTIDYSSPSCTLRQAGQVCPILPDQTFNFKVRLIGNQAVNRRFGFYKDPSLNKFQLYVEFPNSGQTFKFYADLGEPNQTNKSEYQIKVGNEVIARLEAGFDDDNGISAMRCVSMNALYEVVRITPYGEGRSVESDEDFEKFEPGILVAPNPFSESLDILLPQPSTETVQFQLFNLSGQKVLDQQFPAGSDLYTLSTADLIPGFYMLRIEANGEFQTIKVIKAD